MVESVQLVTVSYYVPNKKNCSNHKILPYDQSLNSRFTKKYIKKFGKVPSLRCFPHVCSGWSRLGCAGPSKDAVGAWR